MIEQQVPPTRIDRYELIMKPDQERIVISAQPKLYFVAGSDTNPPLYIPQLELSFVNGSGAIEAVPPGGFFALVASYSNADLSAKIPVELRLVEGISGTDWTLSATTVDDTTGLARAWYSDVEVGDTQQLRIVCRESIALPDSQGPCDDEEHLHFSATASCTGIDIEIDAYELGTDTRERHILPLGVSFVHDPWLKVKRKTCG